MVVCLICYLVFQDIRTKVQLVFFFFFSSLWWTPSSAKQNEMLHRYTKWSFILLQNCVRLTSVHCTCTLYTKLIFWLQYQTSSQALIKVLWRFLSFTVGAFSFSVAMLTVIDLADFQQLSNQPPVQQKLIIFLIISVGDAALLDAAKKGNLTRVCTQYCSLASGFL